MSITQQVKCDGPKCGVMKQESNHWFWLLRRNGYVEFGMADTLLDAGYRATSESRLFDLCGEKCLMSIISEIVSRKAYLAAAR